MDYITSPNAPAAIGPYSQAIRTGGLLFLSGQIPLDPATGNIAEGGIREQTAQVLRNIDAVLTEAGLSAASVVKTTAFLTDMGDFAAFNEVYATYFTGKPARSCVAVVALPKGAIVEIEVVAEG
ncbi:MAG: RidA family protein [Oscillospiraceae bacterium]|jgi:2-iminobutanoate/2-iminopropanoate deaminase|nr:RidA family protein [Oscillospiraceae bacterium]